MPPCQLPLQSVAIAGPYLTARVATESLYVVFESYAIMSGNVTTVWLLIFILKVLKFPDKLVYDTSRVRWRGRLRVEGKV